MEDGIDNWTEDDFKPHQVETSPGDDLRSLDPRVNSSSDDESPVALARDNALSRRSEGVSSGIFVPSVDRIRPYDPSRKKPTNSNHTSPTTLHPVNEETNGINSNGSTKSIYDIYGDLPDYDSDLHEELFERTDSSSNINRNLKIDEWLASLGQLENDTIEKITRILMDFTNERFAFWIKWLRGKHWDEMTLNQFFSFREFYKNKPEYWQFFQRRYNYWEIRESYYNFGLNVSLVLVKRSIDLPFDQIIDDEWLQDWHDLHPDYLWINDCLSFSKFALYRSQLSYSEDWKCREDLGYDFESTLFLTTKNGGIRKYIPGSNTICDISELTSPFDSYDWLD